VRNEGDTTVLVCWFCFGREHEEQCLGFFLILMKNDLLGLVGLIFVFVLVNYLVALDFVWLKSHHISFLPISCLCHVVMSSFPLCPPLIGWVTSLSIIPFD